MDSIKKDVISVIGFAIALIVIVTIMTIIVLGCEGDKAPIKTSITIMSNYIGAIATFSAAYIASLLFTDWRQQEKVIFTRDMAISTVELLYVLFNTMQDHRDKNENLLSQIVKLDTQIKIKMAFLKKHIKNQEIELVNNNFQGFVHDYLDVLKKYQHDPQELKNHVSKIIRSFNAETSYLTKLADIDTVFEKISKSALN